MHSECDGLCVLRPMMHMISLYALSAVAVAGAPLVPSNPHSRYAPEPERPVASLQRAPHELPHRPAQQALPGRAQERTLQLHADTSFDARERTLLRRAALRLENETYGLVHLEIVFDLDFDDLGGLRRREAVPAILRVSSSSDVARLMDRTNRGETLGYTSVRPIRVHLVANRLGDADQLFEHVAMHEFLHAFGAGHVRDPGALLHANLRGERNQGGPAPVRPLAPVLSLAEADRVELRRALGPSPPDLDAARRDRARSLTRQSLR